MRVLYLDCSMGAAGDMLSAALFELMPDREAALAELNRIGIPGVRYFAEPSEKCGITGTHFRVDVCGEEEHTDEETHGSGQGHPHHDHDHPSENHDDGHHRHHHEHHGLEEICGCIRKLSVSETVRTNAVDVYRRIAEAEAKVHGKIPEQIHFHEVGTWDAVADVVAVCWLMEQLAPERVTASSVRTGFGTVHCAHGTLPVPAPATALLLEGIPVFSGDIPKEMCTPTGAALLKHFVCEFGTMPAMTICGNGYGMGTRSFENQANCVRATLGETGDDVVELSCNVDDMSPEDIGYAFDALLEGGAVDVWYEAISMKKNRPGVILSCLCRPEKRDEIVRLMFRHTTTIGIRESVCRRYVLKRREFIEETPFGPIRFKESEGCGICRRKAEYEDLARISREQDIPIAEIRKIVQTDES